MNGTNGNMEIVREFVANFWNEGDSDRAEQLLSDDYVDHAYVPGNKEGLLNMAGILRTAFPDQTSEEESIIVEGDRVVIRLQLKGTHLGIFRGTKPSHRKVDVRVYREYRIVNGRIAEHWALLDTASLLRQIGAELNEQPACRVDRK